MTQLPLLVVLDSYHDLPPKWDGQPVTWGEWSREAAVFMCYRGRRKPPDQRCGCGGFGTQTCTGRVAGVVALTAIRCCGCGVDQVVEMSAGSGPDAWRVWNLEWPQDYGDEGSTG